MGIFKKLGLALTPKVDADKPFEIHPLARTAHTGVLVSWVLGSTIEALHPTDGWVVVDRPVFEPETQYRVAGYVTETSEELRVFQATVGRRKSFSETLMAGQAIHTFGNTMNLPADVAGVPVPDSVVRAPKPQTTTRFVRGDIWEAVNGRSYLVLGNKHDIVSDGRYDAAQDPDKYPLILVRYEEGMKQSVTHRDLMGRRDLAPNENLVKRTGSINLPPITPNGIVLQRKKDHVVVSFRSFETVIQAG